MKPSDEEIANYILQEHTESIHYFSRTVKEIKDLKANTQTIWTKEVYKLRRQILHQAFEHMVRYSIMYDTYKEENRIIDPKEVDRQIVKSEIAHIPDIAIDG